LSRLNGSSQISNGENTDRIFVLDFVNHAAAIQTSFEPYYTEARRVQQ